MDLVKNSLVLIEFLANHRSESACLTFINPETQDEMTVHTDSMSVDYYAKFGGVTRKITARKVIMEFDIRDWVEE